MKKSLFSLVVLIYSLIGYGQSNVSAKWGRFNLLAIDTTWKYQKGFAKPEYFEKTFDDGGWQTISNKFLDNVGFINSDWNGIGVFRKKFIIPDSLKGRQFEIFLSQFGASKIYLDGKLAKQFGNITAPAKDEIANQKAVPVNPDSGSVHVIAICFSNQMIDQDVIAKYQLWGYGITLSAINSEGEVYNDDYLHHSIISLGIILSFCLFFFFVFAFYPYRFASLISALMLISFSLIFAGGMFRDFMASDASQFTVGEKLWEIGFSCSYGWYLLYLFSIYYNKMPWRTWVVAGLMATSIVLILSLSAYWFSITRIFMLVYLIEAWRIIILGIRKKRTGFWIIAIGLFLSISGTLIVIFNIFNLFPWYLTTAQNILGIATDMSFPLTLALQLAWEFGSSNRDLRLQLAHVNELSAKNLQQEQEKQLMLSTQNEMLDQQVTQRTSELKHSLDELKSAQAQLIQSEKMASLGELTAGIAHEIQNPLNFVNNFSEVSSELIDELKAEITNNNKDDAIMIADDLKQNLEKINHHGKRADAIVKGMLQHSRSSTGVKEATNINALADEYLRLAYHGLRAKDKDFNATLKTDFDSSIEKINIISQDIGRVLLNLYNNAFYAVGERRKLLAVSYEPLVSVSTKKLGNQVFITVSDNGNGIPQKIVDKIFQPFFTTKPTGQGTGLGLSLSYDIIKAHGGEIKVETKEGEGTTFIIQLPT